MCLQITLAVYHGLVVYLRKEQFAHVTMVGYSAVVFGLMTLSAMSEPLPGVFQAATSRLHPSQRVVGTDP